MILPGSYQNGFAPRDGRPLYPELWRGCVGAWAPCLGPTGLTLRDWSGFGNHGTLTNMDAGAAWVPNNYGYALDFEGTNDYVAMPLRTNTHSDHTQSGWVMTRSTAFQYCIALEGFCSPPSSWFLIRIDIDASRRAYGYVYDGASREIGNTLLTVGKMTHVAMTRSGNLFTFYVNGSATGSATYVPALIATSPTINDVGARRNVPTMIPLNGRISEIMVHNRPLNAREIQLLASRRGIAYEMAPRRRSSSAVQFNRRRRLLVGAGT